MKFIYFSDSNLVLDQVITDCSHLKFEVAKSTEELFQQAVGECLVFMVLESAITPEVLQWRQKNPDIKLMLISKGLSDAYLRDIQLEHSFYDLFFRYPVSFLELDKNLRVILPNQSANWNQGEASLTQTGLKMELSVDNPSTPVVAEIEPEVLASELAADTTEINLLNLDQNTRSTQEKTATGLTLDVASLETPHQEEPVNMVEADKVSTENEDLILEAGDKQPEIEVMEPSINSLMSSEKSLTIESMVTHPVLPQGMNSTDTHIVPPSSPLEKIAQTQGVSLNEILESKEDQIFRLLSQNNHLNEEIVEKEELIKTLQRELKEQQDSFDKNRNNEDDSKLQLSIIKGTHDKEKQELQRQVDLAQEKNKVLEQRMEELKAEWQKAAQNNLSAVELRKIKARQEHLEEKISLLQSDSAMQLQNREKKIVELKRKVDLLEFDLKDSQEREKEFKKKIHQAESKLAQMKQVLKQVVEEAPEAELDLNKKTGSYDV